MWNFSSCNFTRTFLAVAQLSISVEGSQPEHPLIRGSVLTSFQRNQLFVIMYSWLLSFLFINTHALIYRHKNKILL